MDFKPKTYKNNERSWTNFLGLCKGCGLCIEKCPRACLGFSKEDVGYYGTPAVKCDIDHCTSCRICEVTCPDCAILVSRRERPKSSSKEK